MDKKIGFRINNLKISAATIFLIYITFAPGFSLASLHNIVVLQGLDKVTARVHTFEAPLLSTIRFGTLEIIARRCDKRPPEETPESAAFLDILEVRQGEPTQSLFRGWMFASSPALSALEHPVYDVWVLDCLGQSEILEKGRILPLNQ